jgi:hypothetical protein
MTQVELRPVKHLDIRAGQLAFRGQFAYTGWDSLVVIDVSVPEQATVIGQTAPDPTARGLAVAASAQYVYAAAAFGGGFRVYDVSNPAAPTAVGALDLPGQAGSIAAAPDRVYVDGFAVRAGRDSRFESTIYVAIVDVREPKRLSVSQVDAHHARQLQIHDTCLYATCSRNTLGVFRLGDPTTHSPWAHLASLGPNTLGTSRQVEAGKFVRVGRLALRGSIDDMHLHYPYAHFALERGEACLVDVTIPEKPKVLARYPLPGQPPVRTAGVAVLGHYAIFSRRGLGLHIVDFRDPSRPEPVDTYPLVPWMGGVYIHGGYLYVQETADGIHIFQIELED